jgi:hypothetical protein
MTRINSLALLGVMLAGSGAWAQLDCGSDGSLCETTQYGLGELPDFRYDTVPPEQGMFDFSADDFGPDFGGVSYYYTRGSFQSQNPNCGPERAFFPYPGQIFLRERTDCTPTSQGPTCSGGEDAGQPCHVVPADGTVAGYVNPFAPIECPGGTCMDSVGGCRVEIPISNGGSTAPAQTSDALLPTLVTGIAGSPLVPFTLSAHATTTWGGSSHGFCNSGPTPEALCRSDADCGVGGTCTLSRASCQGGTFPGARCTDSAQCGVGGTCVLLACSPTNFRHKPSMGTRYVLPLSRGGNPGDPDPMTYVRWDYGQVDVNQRVPNSTALRVHSDSSVTCCQSSPSACNQLVPGSPVYPLLNRRTCAVPNRFATEDNLTNDWIFEGGRGTRFHTDRNHQLPGQLVGVCKVNRTTPCSSPAANARCSGPATPYACCTGPGTGNCGSECAGLEDTCDLTDPGHRAQIALARDSFGDPRPTACAANLYVLRGTPDQGCTLEPPFAVPGDPGDDCGLFNYGQDRRYDGDCDGVADFADGCPFLSEWDQDTDADGDCALPGGVDADCRLDECECGDESGDGWVDVSDIVETSVAIFTGVNHRLCDSNSDLVCNVQDIVGTNLEIFVPDSSGCRHITSSLCGNNLIDPGEPCDNGARCQGGPTPGAACDATAANVCGTGGNCARLGGDGCNTACRIERGWSCTGSLGSPSVCTPQ